MELRRKKRIEIKDWPVTALLALAVLLLCLLSLNNFCYWGDDHAAYLNQAIAIAEGRFEEQSRLNYLMHPSEMVDEAADGRLVYVWAYSLLLALVYSLAGFDRLAYSTVFLYKLPSALALAGIASLLYIFFRRRMDKKLSFFLALLFCCCEEFFTFLNTLYGDLVFLFFALLSLTLTEAFWHAEEKKKQYIWGIASGAALWFCCELRHNGIAILLACILGHAISLREQHRTLRKSDIFPALCPYLTFAGLLLLSSLWLPSATGSSSDMDGASLALLAENLKYYLGLIWHWLGLLINSILINPLYSVLRRLLPISYASLSGFKSICCALAALLTVIGLISDGLKRNLHLTVLLLVYIIFVSALPYTQGLRYIYPLLPLILMYTGCALQRLWRLLPIKLREARAVRLLGWAVLAVLCFFILLPRISDIGNKWETEAPIISSPAEVYMQNSYSPAAIEAYNFIQAETPEDCTIAFFAPRGLYLNTGRLAVKPGANGHSMDEADYFLRYLLDGGFEIIPLPEEGFEKIFENEEFELYKKLDGDMGA